MNMKTIEKRLEALERRRPAGHGCRCGTVRALEDPLWRGIAPASEMCERCGRLRPVVRFEEVEGWKNENNGG